MNTLGATLKIGGQCPALKMKSAMSGPGIRKVCLSGLRWTSSDVLSTTKAPAWGKVCSLWWPCSVIDSMTVIQGVNHTKASACAAS